MERVIDIGIDSYNRMYGLLVSHEFLPAKKGKGSHNGVNLKIKLVYEQEGVSSTGCDITQRFQTYTEVESRVYLNKYTTNQLFEVVGCPNGKPIWHGFRLVRYVKGCIDQSVNEISDFLFEEEDREEVEGGFDIKGELTNRGILMGNMLSIGRVPELIEAYIRRSILSDLQNLSIQKLHR